MSMAVLDAVSSVLYEFLESVGEDDHLYPDTPWAHTGKRLALKLQADLLDVFVEQAKRYASRIPKTAGRVKEAEPSGGLPSWVEGTVLSDDVAWQKELARVVLPYTSGAMQGAAEITAAEFNIGINFDIGDPRISEIIKSRSIEFAGEVQRTSHDAVVRALAKGVDDGASIYDMQQEIKGLPEFDNLRAERAARTEVISAMNAGEAEAYGLMGAAAKKWKAAHDSRTRDAHRRADGQVVFLNEKFRVGGEKLEHPGDGSAKNRINCRCRMVPIFDKERAEKERAAWSEDKGQADWTQTKAEKDAITKARLDNQRQRQQDYIDKQGGKHADGKRVKARSSAAQASGTQGTPAGRQQRVEAARQMVGRPLDEAEPVLARIEHKECAFLARPDGTVFEFIEGDYASISIPDPLYPQMKGNVFTHNHHVPVAQGGIESFSPEDIAVACESELAEIHAVTPTGTRFVMKPPPSGWDVDFFDQHIVPLAQHAEVKAEQEALLLVRSGDIINQEQYANWTVDRIWELIAQWASLTYEKSAL